MSHASSLAQWCLRLALVVRGGAGCADTADNAGTGGSPPITLSFGGAGAEACAAAAGSADAGEAGISAGCAESVAVNYARDIAPILARCTGEVCHHFDDTANVRSWLSAPADECCNRRQLIAPGQPAKSYLIDKLEGQRLCAGARMPLERPPLPDSDIATLAAWICDGAEVP